jgi:hypothetical protein
MRAHFGLMLETHTLTKLDENRRSCLKNFVVPEINAMPHFACGKLSFNPLIYEWKLYVHDCILKKMQRKKTISRQSTY